MQSEEEASITRSMVNLIESYDTLGIQKVTDLIMDHFEKYKKKEPMVKSKDSLYHYDGHSWVVWERTPIVRVLFQAFKKIPDDLKWYATYKTIRQYLESAYFWRFVEQNILRSLEKVQLDNNQDLFCFSNGVFNFKTLTFRPTLPEDYVCKFASFNYAEPSLKNLEDLDKILNLYFQDGQKQHFLNVLSLSLRGNHSANSYCDTIILETNWGGGHLSTLINRTFSSYYAIDKLERSYSNIVGLDKINKRILEIRNNNFSFESKVFELITSRSESRKPYTVLYRSDINNDFKEYYRHEKFNDGNVYTIKPRNTAQVDSKKPEFNIETLSATLLYVLFQNYIKFSSRNQSCDDSRLSYRDVYLSSHTFWVKECGCECCLYKYTDIHVKNGMLIPYIGSYELDQDIHRLIQMIYFSL